MVCARRAACINTPNGPPGRGHGSRSYDESLRAPQGTRIPGTLLSRRRDGGESCLDTWLLFVLESRLASPEPGTFRRGWPPGAHEDKQSY